jgi:hypothetical protein
MTYGIEFSGANQQLILDSNVTSGDTLTISGGIISTIGTNATVSADLDEEFLFLRPSASTGVLTGNTIYNGSVATVTVGQSTKYFKAKKSSLASNIATGGSYGLELYNPSGAVTFSTRKAVNAMNIVGTASPGYNLSGTQYGTFHNSIVYSGTTSNVYVSVSFIYKQNLANINSYIFNSSNIVFSSTVPGPFGTIPLPLFGQAIFSEIKS